MTSPRFTEADLERASEAFSRPDAVQAIAQLIADVRAEEREQCAVLVQARCTNRVTGAVLAGLIRGGNWGEP